MSDEEALNKLFERLCRDCKGEGSNAWVQLATLVAALGIPNEQHDNLFERIANEGVFELSPDRKRIRLGKKGLEMCDNQKGQSSTPKK